MTTNDIDVKGALAWLAEAGRYFGRRPTHGEDAAYWANASNAENCRRIATLLARQEELLAEAGKWQASLVEIVDLKPEPIGDTGFVVGPAALLRRAREIALEAVRPARKSRAAARLSDKLKGE